MLLSDNQRNFLNNAWTERGRLRKQGDALLQQSIGIQNQAIPPYSVGNQVYAAAELTFARAEKLQAQAELLGAEGNEIWASAVLQVCGNTLLEWLPSGGCRLEGGAEFSAGT